MLNKEKINIGWRKCFVFDYYNVKRCYKCWGYYHIAKNCTRQETCFKCAGNHKASDCTTTKKRCVNCMHKIKMYNLKINDEHEAMSVKCPTYIRALEEEKKRTGWDSTIQQPLKEEILYLNAQSLMAHKEEIQHQIMQRMNPAILALSESSLVEDIEDSEVNIPGYSVARCDAENRNTGGVILYIRNDLNYEVVLSDKIISNCWCIAVKVKSRLYRGIIALVYHSPSASDGDFISFLVNTMDILLLKDKCLLIGDVNINLMADSYYTKKLKTEMIGLGMKQYVDKPTRITNNSKTLIDVVLANININYKVQDKPKR